MSFITRDVAKKEIKKILDNAEPIKTGITLPIRQGKKFNVYQIPLDYLVPNVLNDRIAWKIREYEAVNGKKLSVDNEQDIEYTYSCIKDENKNENADTIKDLAEKGQQVDGIITNNGIIIDGNRRATLLRELFRGEANKYHKNIEEFRYFNAIVLTEDISDKEIMALETSIQIGEDQKVGYNPICIYIKIDNLSRADYNSTQIANYMNIKPSDVETKKAIFKLMNEYLESIGKPEHYTLLDGLEDQFINTRNVFKKLDSNTYNTYDWEPTEEDITDFKQVCYDYLRSKFEGKKYRDVLIGKPNKADGVFINKEVWDEFYKNHEEILDNNNPSSEEDWELLGKKQFKDNLNNASKKLQQTLQEKDVSSLISIIQTKVKNLAEKVKEQDSLSTDDVKNLKEIYKEIYEIYKDFQ